MSEIYAWKPLVYCAGPITHRGAPPTCACQTGPDRSKCPVVQLNLKHAVNVAMALIGAGYAPIVPQSSIGFPGAFEIHYETWMGVDFNYIDRCDILCRIDGPSSGADREVVHARSKLIPVLNPETLLCYKPSDWGCGDDIPSHWSVVTEGNWVKAETAFAWWGHNGALERLNELIAARQPLPRVVDDGTTDIQTMVMADLEARRQYGIKKYGTALRPNNGRDGLRDLYEELQDAVVYAKQLLVERESGK